MEKKINSEVDLEYSEQIKKSRKAKTAKIAEK